LILLILNVIGTGSLILILGNPGVVSFFLGGGRRCDLISKTYTGAVYILETYTGAVYVLFASLIFIN